MQLMMLMLTLPGERVDDLFLDSLLSFRQTLVLSDGHDEDL